MTHLSHTWVGCCSRIHSISRYCGGFHSECKACCRKTQWFLRLQQRQERVCGSLGAIWAEGSTGRCLFGPCANMLNGNKNTLWQWQCYVAFYSSPKWDLEATSCKWYLLHMRELRRSTWRLADRPSAGSPLVWTVDSSCSLQIWASPLAQTQAANTHSLGAPGEHTLDSWRLKVWSYILYCDKWKKILTMNARKKKKKR